MWRNDLQACHAIRKLLDSIALAHMWTPAGPTDEAVKLLKDGGFLSSGEQLMLRIAFDFWNGHGETRFNRMLDVLDRKHIDAVCTLAMALVRGGSAIDDWIAS